VGTGTDGKLPLQKPVSQVRILPGALTFPQVSVGFRGRLPYPLAAGHLKLRPGHRWIKAARHP